MTATRNGRAVGRREAARSHLALAVEGEPQRPERVRYPGDLLRSLLSLALLALLGTVGSLLSSTLGGVEEDLENAIYLLPGPILSLLGGITTLIGVLFPVAALGMVALRRSWLVLAQVMLAATLALLTFGLITKVIRDYASTEYASTILGPAAFKPGGAAGAAFIASAFASTVVTAVVLPATWQRTLRLAVLLFAVYSLVSAPLSFLAVVGAVVIGWGTGSLVLYLLGSPNPRPTMHEIADGLAAVGLSPARLKRLNPQELGVRIYEMTEVDGRRVRIRVRDRFEYSAGLVGRFLRRFWLRGTYAGGPAATVRALAEREALVTVAASAAGARVVPFLAAAEAGDHGLALAYEFVPGTPLDQLPLDQVTDDVLRDTWRELGTAIDARVTHRRPTLGQAILDPEDRVWLTQFTEGNVASTDLQIRVDVAHLLISMALRVGPDRAVRTAVEILGPTTVAAALPAMQPLALDKNTRAAVKQAKGLLEDLRNTASTAVGMPPLDVQAEELRRLSPQRLVTILAAALALYLVLPQIATLDIEEIWDEANLAWAAVAIVFAFLSYYGAALGIVAFVPTKIPIFPAIRAQLAAAFASLIAPSFVGVLAVNTRFLQRRGVDPAVGVTVMGVNSLANLVVNVFWLLVLIALGASTSTEFSIPAEALWLVSLALVAAITVVVLIPPLRRWAVRQIGSLVNRVGPALLGLVQQPTMLAKGFLGLTITILMKSVALQASLFAFGADLDFVSTAAVFIIGNSLGMLLPTPGGLGGVEAAMTAALTAAGVNSGVAVLAVLLFRLATFWLPLIPGWLSFNQMQRKGEL